MNEEKIKRSDVEDIISLSPAQVGILYESLKSDCISQYVAQITLLIRGKMQLDILEKAIDCVTKKNLILRCIYRWENLSNPIQIVLNSYKIPCVVNDFSTYKEDAQKLILERKEEIRNSMIRIEKQPVVIYVFLDCEDYIHLVITWHHIVYDGWSNMIFLREIFDTYDYLTQGTAMQEYVKASYKDYLSWLSNLKNTEKNISFWKNHFKGYTEQLGYSEGNTVNKEYFTMTLSDELYSGLKSFQKKEEFNLSTIYYCAWFLLMFKMTGKYDLCVGITMSGRSGMGAGIEQTIGMFTNTLPLRCVLNDNMKIIELMNTIKQTIIQFIGYETMNIIDIMKYANLQKVPFRSIVVVESYPMQLSQWVSENGEYYIESFQSIENNNCDLLLGVLPPKCNTILIQYNGMLYRKSFIERMANYYVMLLRFIIHDNGLEIGKIEQNLYSGLIGFMDKCSMSCEEINIGQDVLW